MNLLGETLKQNDNYERQDIEWRKCRASPLYFLKTYGKIPHPDRGIISWEPWAHLIYVLDCLAKYRFIIILKPKQIGITTLMSGVNLHLALFKEGANILTLSKGENEAGESLYYSKFMHSQLPSFLRPSLDKDQASFLRFPAIHSRLRALPSTEDAGVGFGGATRVVMDEFEYHNYAEKNYAEIYPAIEKAGQLVILSTADKTRINTKFKELYIATMAGGTRFFKIFLPFNVLPERTEEWYNTLDLATWEKECRYPRNEKDALETLKSRRFFDQLAIEGMYAELNAIQPIRHDLSDKYKGLVRIYRLPVIGRKYCLFTDPSDGKDDPHALIVMDASTGEEMAESHGKCPADQVAQIHDDLARLYNAFNSFELNAVGMVVRDKLKDMATPNQCGFWKSDGKLDNTKLGWYTGSSLRNKALWGLEEAIRLRQIIPHSKECVDEFSQFIQPEGDDPQPPRGGHDDYIDAWGRVWLLRKYMPSTTGVKVTSFKYKETL